VNINENRKVVGPQVPSNVQQWGGPEGPERQSRHPAPPHNASGGRTLGHSEQLAAMGNNLHTPPTHPLGRPCTAAEALREQHPPLQAAQAAPQPQARQPPGRPRDLEAERPPHQGTPGRGRPRPRAAPSPQRPQRPHIGGAIRPTLLRRRHRERQRPRPPERRPTRRGEIDDPNSPRQFLQTAGAIRHEPSDDTARRPVVCPSAHPPAHRPSSRAQSPSRPWRNPEPRPHRPLRASGGRDLTHAKNANSRTAPATAATGSRG
jgi:hypothetical protein